MTNRNFFNSILIVLALIIVNSKLFAQINTPDISLMIKKEKKEVVSAISELTKNLKLKIDDIYSDYESMITTHRSADFEAKKKIFNEANEQKDSALKELLNKKQYEEYQVVINKRRPPRKKEKS